MVSKPQLRGLLSGNLKKNAVVGFTFAISMACLWKFGFAERRKQLYMDYYKNYDGQKDFERMRDAGVFRSVKPDGKPGDID